MAMKRPDTHVDYHAVGAQLPVPSLGKERRSRGWFLSINYAYLAEAFRRMGYDGFSEDDFRVLMLRLCSDYMAAHKGCVWMLLKFHDQDPAEDEHGTPIVNPDGTCDAYKGLHAHVDLYDETTPRWGTLVAWFHMSDRKENAIAWSGVRHRTRWVNYITHSNQRDREAGKYEYDLRDVRVWVRGIPDDGAPEHRAMCEAFYRHLRSGHMPEDADARASEKSAFEKLHGDLVFCGKERPDDVKLLLENDGPTRKRLAIQSDTTYPARVYNLMLQRQADRMAALKRYYVDDANPRRLLTAYIKAPGLSSKTHIAYLLARHINEENGCSLGIQQIAAPGNRRLTFDPAGSYNGELVAIINEFLYRAFGGSAAKDLLDPTVAAIANSRNVDKFWPIQYLIATASTDPEEQVRGVFSSLMEGQVHRGDAVATGRGGRFSNEDWDNLMVEKDGDQLNQLARRLSLVIEMVPANLVVVGHARWEPWTLEAGSDHIYSSYIDPKEQDGHLSVHGLTPGSFVVVISGYDSFNGRARQLDFHGNHRACKPLSSVTCEQTGEALFPSVVKGEWNGNDRRYLGLAPMPADRDPHVTPSCSGRWTPLVCLVYHPGDAVSEAMLVDAFDIAEREYYRMNRYDKNPDTVPFMPDLKAYAASRAESIRKAADAFERAQQEGDGE